MYNRKRKKYIEFSALNLFDFLKYRPTNTKKNERRMRIKAIAEQVGLTQFLSHKPHELSGGQKQRVAIARSLINNPAVVLADEPTANLDSQTSKQILDLMVELNEVQQITFVFSTHQSDVRERTTRTITLQDGRTI